MRIKRNKKDRSIARGICIKARSPNLKLKAFEYAGGKCVDCGLKLGTTLLTDNSIVFDFHHVISPKFYNIGRIIAKAKSWELIRAEIDKCVLLCSNCHRLRHNGKTENIESVKEKKIEDYPLFGRGKK